MKIGEEIHIVSRNNRSMYNNPISRKVGTIDSAVEREELYFNVTGMNSSCHRNMERREI